MSQPPQRSRTPRTPCVAPKTSDRSVQEGDSSKTEESCLLRMASAQQTCGWGTGLAAQDQKCSGASRAWLRGALEFSGPRNGLESRMHGTTPVSSFVCGSSRHRSVDLQEPQALCVGTQPQLTSMSHHERSTPMEQLIQDQEEKETVDGQVFHGFLQALRS